MKINYKFNSAILLVVCLLVFLHLAFAQNPDVLKSEIYSKIKCCACQVPFDKCICAEAKEMKAYIDALLESGLNKEDIFYKVAKKFSLSTILDEQIKQNVKERLINEAGEKRPEIVLDAASFDFGKVTKKQGKISKVFKLTNKGNLPLIIKNLKTSCPCAGVSLRTDKVKSPYFGIEGSPKDWLVEIAPSQNAGLELMVDLASGHVKIGKLIREATITTNDPIYPEVTVSIEAEVNEYQGRR